MNTTSKRVRFVAYIDESGDTGLRKVRPKNPNGASEWLVLSCFLVRIDRDKEIPTWKREIMDRFVSNQRKDLHFAGLLPAKKKIACESLAAKPCRFFVVMSNKRNIEGYKNPNLDDGNKAWIYWFLTRLLLERVTEYCELQTLPEDRGKAILRITFSRRGGLRYIDFVNYLRKLERQSRAGMLVLGQGDIRWSLIDFDEIRVLDHSLRDGLQLADVGAGSFFQAVERNRPADCDPQFAKLLSRVIARRGKAAPLSFGIKVMPELATLDLDTSQRELFEFYGYNPEGWRTPGG